jgi:hypothetical protein
VKLADGLVALKGATISSPIDSFYISKSIFDNILLRSASQRVSAHSYFPEIESTGKSKVTLLNGESFLDFINLVITRDYSGLIRGHKVINGAMSCESLRIDKYLNNYKFPEDLVSRSQRRLLISGYKNFTSLFASKVRTNNPHST